MKNRARAGKHRIGRPPALIPEYVERCRGMADECAGLRHMARVDGLLTGYGEEGVGRRAGGRTAKCSCG